MSRTRRAGWTFMTGVAGTAALMLAGLAATPLLLRWLGDEPYGAFKAAFDWMGYLTLFDLALAGALVPPLARSVAAHDARSVAAVLGAAVRAYLLSAGV